MRYSLRRPARTLFFHPPTIKGGFAAERALTISPNLLKKWWPGTELNRRRQPFQGCSRPKLSVDSARLSITSLPDFALFIGAKMEPSGTNLSLPRFASNRRRLRVDPRSNRPTWKGWSRQRGATKETKEWMAGESGI